MGFFGPKYEIKEGHKWHYLNLNDFRSRNCIEFLSYVWIWVMAIAACAVYVLDTYTAVRLLASNSWSSVIQYPKDVINFDVVKWIFSGCIIFSWVLCFYEWYRAYRVMQKESIAEDYLDPLVVTIQSVRIPQGWKRFLVFAELTKSKKKAAWICFFVYFQRKGALRILAAEGPRMAINAMSLYFFAQSSLGFTVGQEDAGSLMSKLFQNIEVLAKDNKVTAAVFVSMLFTLVIWIFSMIFLIAAILFWLFFISCFLKKETLTGYCRRKVEKRLGNLITQKTDNAWEREQKAAEKKNGKLSKSKVSLDEEDAEASLKKEPTLPVFSDYNDSVSTLPAYEAEDDDSLINNAGPMGTSHYHRPSTSNSNMTYNSGYSRDPRPPLPSLSTNMSDPRFPPSARMGTPMSAAPSSAERRYSPQNSWKGRNSPDEGSEESYELQEPNMPSALMAGGPSRHNTPGPQRSFTDSPMTGLPRSMTPGGPGGPFPRNMTPGGPLPRSMTPGTPGSLPRSMTPGAPPSAFTPGGGMPPRSFTPGGPPPSNLVPRGLAPRGPTPGGPMNRQYHSESNFDDDLGPRSATPEIPSRSPKRTPPSSPPRGSPQRNQGPPRMMNPGYGSPYQRNYYNGPGGGGDGPGSAF